MCDVLIIGAGPTGLTLAAELVRRGIAVRLIDKSPPTHTSNALGIQARTLELFDRMGISAEFVRRGLRARDVFVHAGRNPHIAHVSFDGLDTPFPFLLILPQSETERILRENLERWGGRVERGTELVAFEQKDDGVTARLRRGDGTEETTAAQWLVGCDGAHSSVRHQLGLPFEGASYPEAWMLADVQVDWTQPDNALAVFLSDDGVLAAFPLGNGHWRLIADNLPAAVAGRGRPTLDEWRDVAKRRGPSEMRLREATWLAAFRIHRRRTPRLRVGRAFLAGDAAHIHSPVGGQGMNTGIQDAENLAWKLALTVHRDAAPDLLDSYEAERLPVAEAVLRQTDLLTRIVSLPPSPARRLRDILAPLVVRAAGKRLPHRISELAVAYPDSPIVGEDTHSIAFRTGPAPGTRAPDAPLRRADKTPLRLFDLLRGGTHTLLLLPGNAPSPANVHRLAQIGAVIDGDYGQKVACFLITTSTPSDGLGVPALRDPDGALHTRYAASVPSLYLVRPDGLIGFRAQPPFLAPLRRHLARTFAHPHDPPAP